MLTKTRKHDLKTLASKMQVEFKSLELLHQALTHASYAYEQGNGGVEHNERLEFLGDAVIELVISEMLFSAYPSFTEGQLTKIRAAVVCEPSLAQHAKLLGLGCYLLLGKGEEAAGGRERFSLLADAFEAVIGAIYLDRGMDFARKFIRNQLANAIKLAAEGNYVTDYKTTLQELIQKQPGLKPKYKIVREEGPDHNKIFFTEVRIGDKVWGTGKGKSKKEAEQVAAKQALEELGENLERV